MLQKLRIGLDCRPTEQGFKAHYGRGTGRYTTELIRELFLVAAEHPESTPEFSRIKTEDLTPGVFQRLLLSLSPLGRVTLQTQVFLPRSLSKLRVDMVHFFAHGDAPLRLKLPYVTTVLDLIPLKFAEMYKADKPDWRFRLARFLELGAIQNARGLIAISEATKQDIVDLLHIPPERIRVTPLAVSPDFRPRSVGADELESYFHVTRSRLGLPSDRPVMLYVGGIDPRKNIFFLLSVLQALKQCMPSAVCPVLVMIGRYQTELEFPKLSRWIKELGLEGDVILPGFVSDALLPEYYHAASLTLFPSLYEGFGFPVLESMACGVPVVAGNNSSIPEVVGSSQPMVQTGNLEQWVLEIRSLLSSSALQIERGRLGERRAGEFSWRKTAELTLEAYEYFSSAR